MTTISIIILIIVLGVLFYVFNTQRELVRLDELCKNAFSQIAVQLNSRWDAVLALAKMAAQYSKHESETIIKTIQARRMDGQVKTAAEANEQQGAFAQVLGRLIAVGEAYPELKANEQYSKSLSRNGASCKRNRKALLRTDWRSIYVSQVERFIDWI